MRSPVLPPVDISKFKALPKHKKSTEHQLPSPQLLLNEEFQPNASNKTLQTSTSSIHPLEVSTTVQEPYQDTTCWVDLLPHFKGLDEDISTINYSTLDKYLFDEAPVAQDLGSFQPLNYGVNKQPQNYKVNKKKDEEATNTTCIEKQTRGGCALWIPFGKKGSSKEFDSIRVHELRVRHEYNQLLIASKRLRARTQSQDEKLIHKSKNNKQHNNLKKKKKREQQTQLINSAKHSQSVHKSPKRVQSVKQNVKRETAYEELFSSQNGSNALDNIPDSTLLQILAKSWIKTNSY